MGRLLVGDGVIDLDDGRVVRTGQVVQLTPSERDLLAYLAARAGRDVTREELHQQVWGHATRVVSRAADTAVHRLRHKIEATPDAPRHLITVPGGYRWVPWMPTSAAPTDTVVLLVAEPLTAGDADWLAGCVALARETGVHLVDLAPDRVVLAAADPVVALAAARALPALAPVRMGLARGPADRLVDPVSGRTLYGGPTLDRAVAIARTATPDQVPEAPHDGRIAGPLPPAGMPVRADRFIGRRALLDTLIDAVGAGPTALVGPAGSGKTRLAEELTARLGRPGWIVRLDHADTLEVALGSVAAAIGMPPGEPTVDEIGRALAGRGPGVLILDGAERVWGVSGPLLARCSLDAPDVHVVLTSRERLPLDGGSVHEVDGLFVDDGVALLVDRCPGLQPSAELCALVVAVDGLPLALELVAPRLRIVGVEQLRSRLDRMVDALVVPSTDGRPNLHRALLESWERLAPAERRVLVRATVFAGGFDLSDAEQVLALEEPHAPWFVDLLGSLCDRHLVHLELPDRRFRLLASVRAFARLQAHADPSLMGDAVRRHAQRFAGLVDRVSEFAGLPFGPGVLADLRLAARAALEGGWVATAVGAARATGELALVGGCSSAMALALVEEVGGLEMELSLRYPLEALRVSLSLRTGRVAEAVRIATGAVALAMQLGGAPLAGRAERLLARALRVAGRADASTAALDRAETLLSGSPDPLDLALVRIRRAELLHATGRIEEALQIALSVADTLDEPVLQTNLAGMIGTLELLLGQVPAAVAHLGQAVEGYQRRGDPFRAANIQLALGSSQALAGDVARGTETLRAAVVTLRAAGVSSNLIIAQVHLARFALWSGDVTAATAELATAAPLAERTTDPRIRGIWLSVQAEALALSGRPEGAVRAGAEARALLASDALATAHLAVHQGMARLCADDVPGATTELAAAEAAVERLEVRPGSLLAHEVRRLRRAIARSGATR